MIEPVRFGDLHKGAYLPTASRLSEQRHVVGVTAEPADIASYPPQHFNDIFHSRIAGVPVFIPEFREIHVAQYVQAVVERYDYQISVTAEISSVVTHLLH